MGDVQKYNLDAINECMRKTQDFKPRFGAIADSLPTGGSDASAYGSLPSSGAVASAVDALNSFMHREFEAAETRLDQIARSLDAVVQSVQNVEDAGVRRMRAV